MVSNFHVHTLEKHQTKSVTDSHVNGELTVLWRDWDKIINDPKMIYLNSIEPLGIKGPHIHKNRTSYFFCIQGTIIIVVQDKNGEYHEIKSDGNTPKLISVSNGIAAAIVNPSDEKSKLLVLADVSWKPDENEMINVKFDEYDFNKWKC